MSENKVTFPGFVGPSYTSRSQRMDCQRLVNMYLEKDESGSGKDGANVVMLSTPGLKLAQGLGLGPIRATYTISNQELMYVISGNEVYQISGDLSIPILLTGNLLTSSGPISICDGGVTADPKDTPVITVLFTDGTNGYTVTVGTSQVNVITDPNFYTCDTVCYQDGYFIGNASGTPSFFVSDVASNSWSALNFQAKSGQSDNLVAVASNNRQLYLFGTRTTEVWALTGNGSAIVPFTRQTAWFLQAGCAAPQTVRTVGPSLFWLSSNAQGTGIVYTLVDNATTRISTHAIEYALSGLDLANATAYAYQEQGHYFYCLNVPGANTTWVYDVATQAWAERQSSPAGFTGRHLAETHGLLNGKHILGDYRNGNIYVQDLDYYKDNGEVREIVRQCPHVAQNLNRMFHKLLEIDMQMGVGLDDDGVNTPASVNPNITLYMSDDGGETWSLPMNASFGKIGAYKTRVRFARLGSSYDRVYRLVSTEPVKTMILSAQIDIEQGLA